VPTVGRCRDEGQFACREFDPESREQWRQDDDRNRGEIGAGQQHLLAERTVGRIVARGRLAMSGPVENRAAAACRQGGGNVNMSLGEVTLLCEGGDRENKQQTPPQPFPLRRMPDNRENRSTADISRMRRIT